MVKCVINRINALSLAITIALFEGIAFLIVGIASQIEIAGNQFYF